MRSQEAGEAENGGVKGRGEGVRKDIGCMQATACFAFFLATIRFSLLRYKWMSALVKSAIRNLLKASQVKYQNDAIYRRWSVLPILDNDDTFCILSACHADCTALRDAYCHLTIVIEEDSSIANLVRPAHHLLAYLESEPMILVVLSVVSCLL